MVVVGASALRHGKEAWILGFRGSDEKSIQLKCKESLMQHGLEIQLPGFWCLPEPQFLFLHSEVVQLGHH